MIDNKTIRKVIMLNKMLPSGSPTYEDREASGAVANFETNTVQPFVKCECTIDATESGTSVLNVEQTGKNRVNLGGTEIASNYDPADSVPFEDGYIIKGKTGNSGYIRPSTTSYSITGDAITVQASLAHYGVGFVIKVEPTQTITVSLASGSKYGVNFYDSTKKYMSSLSYYTEEHTFTIPSGAYWLIVVLVPNNLNTDETFVKVQAELGSTATTYAPYSGATTTVTLEEAAYGGKVDVIAGSGQIIDEYGKLVYTLFEPVSISALEGVNNVWTDAGNTKVTYKYKTGEGGSTKKKYLPIFYDMYGKEKYK